MYSTPSRTHYRRRGTAILIKKSIPHQYLPNPMLRYVEATMVIANIPNLPPINFVSVYNPPSMKYVHFTLDFESIYAYNAATFIAGDMNARHKKWNCLKTCRFGRQLVSFADKTKATIVAPAEYTHHHYRTDSVIDMALVRNVPYAISALTLHELPSDHLPVKFHIDSGTPAEIPKKFIPNWRKFKNYLINLAFTDFAPNSAEDIDGEIERFTANIITAYRASGSWRELIRNETTAEIRAQVCERNKLKRLWHRTRHPADKNNLNRAQNQLRKLYREHDERRWDNFVSGIEPGDDTLWTLVHRYNKDRFSMPPLITDKQVAFRSIDKAEAIADSLAQQFKNNDLSHPPTDFIVNRRVEIMNRRPTKRDVTPCTPTEVAAAIAELKKKKSPGRDGVNNVMIKNLPCNCIFRLTLIINCILKFAHFPRSWKTAVVVPIYKKGKNPQAPDSYRPISLLSSLSKIAESIILSRLEDETEHKLTPYQFGFRKGLSTTEQLLRMVEHIREGFCNKIDTAAVFIDIAKAFDRVWIDGLLYKMHKLKITRKLILLLQSYLKGRSFVVRVGKELSTPRLTEAGVVQGSRLGPHCFNIFINDICQMPDTEICLFADDTAILSSGATAEATMTSLNNHLTELGRWLIKWKIKVNSDKCQAVYFSRKQSLPPPPKIFRRVIPWREETKYLGITLDKKLTFESHFAKITSDFKQARAQLKPLIGKDSKLSLDTRLLIYKSLLRPLISYACPVWLAAANNYIKSLDRAQNVTIRRITRMP
ncbi:putative RNA-directed DNA polymerase from transposon X-element, partial [Araneus ventricosus]